MYLYLFNIVFRFVNIKSTFISALLIHMFAVLCILWIHLYIRMYSVCVSMYVQCVCVCEYACEMHDYDTGILFNGLITIYK